MDNILVRHGAVAARLNDDDAAQYWSSSGNEFFGWPDARTANARVLADLFVHRFPAIAARGHGDDWAYAGWFVRLLGYAEQGFFPVAYNDQGDFTEAPVLPTVAIDGVVDIGVELPLPPPGLARG